jgi:purine-nucleoside/S-methyl-5'-thioadenosine phosphorylase / adenosine deaminase
VTSRAASVIATGLPKEVAPGFGALGVVAFTTTRLAGTFGTNGSESVHRVISRWAGLRDELGARRLTSAKQVHGTHVHLHSSGWTGWLRADEGDGHLSPTRGTAMAVSVADCVPVFIAHPGGATALLHSGWRGTAGRIVERAIAMLAEQDLAPRDLVVHCGPSICGSCYEVSPDVFAALTGRTVERPTTVDLRALIADHAREAGVRDITMSASCTRCDNDRFFSHRAGDDGRQLGVLYAPLP